MYLKEQIVDIKALVKELITVLNNIAERNINTVMPSYTHLQNAQPVTLAHHVLAYVEMFKRDYDRLSDTYKRTNVMLLGSGALAATTYPLDREFVKEQLGFDAITLDSMDGVSDRDFVIELLSAFSMIMMHLSRFCEEIIIWNSQQYKFVEMDDAYSTGSSIMPQKKNPDMAELIRGKTGRVYGHLMAMLTVMKGIPLAYNKDMQEDKEGVFDAVDTLKMCLPVFTRMVDTMTINKDNMRNAARKGFMNATDAADWLVKQGVPFRDAHAIIGQLVLYSINNNKNLDDLTLDEHKAVSDVFTEDIYKAIDLDTCVNTRTVPGGPSEAYIKSLIELNKKCIENLK